MVAVIMYYTDHLLTISVLLINWYVVNCQPVYYNEANIPKAIDLLFPDKGSNKPDSASHSKRCPPCRK